MHGRSLVVLLAYVSGVLEVSRNVVGTAGVWSVAAGVVVLGALVAAAHRPRHGSPRRREIAALIALAAVSCGAGSLNGCRALRSAHASSLLSPGQEELAPGGATMMLEGRLRSDAEPTDFGASLLIDVETLRAPDGVAAPGGAVVVTVSGARAKERLEDWLGGRRVRLPVTMRAQQRYRNPGVADPAVGHVLRGIGWFASAKSALLVEVVGKGNAVQEFAAGARVRSRRAVRRAMALAAPTRHELYAGILVAILVGDRTGIPAEISDRLQRAGTFHVVAISGGNIAILTGLLAGTLRWLRLPPRTASLVTMAGIGSYGLIASGSPSVSRATVVALIYLAGRALDLRPNGFAVLWAAIQVLLVWSPLSLFDPGLLLTVAATVAVMGWRLVATGSPGERGNLEGGALSRVRGPAAPRVRAWGARASAEDPAAHDDGQGRARHLIGWMLAVIAATIAADIVLLPIAATVFSRVSIAGVVLNLAAIPLMAVAQVCGLAIVLLEFLPHAVAHAAAIVAAGSIHVLLESARLVDLWPALSWRVPPPPAVAIVSYYASWAAWAMARRRGLNRLSGVMLGTACLCVAWIAVAPQALPARSVGLPLLTTPQAGPDAARDLLTVVFLDVGQGDATLVRFPSGQTWLVDAGGIPGPSTFDIGARVVVPALWAMEVRRLDVVAVTHPDPDHAGGVPAAVADLRPREVWEGIPVGAHPVMRRVREAAEHQRSHWRRRLRGDRLRIGAVDVRVLHPPAPDWERRRTRNDDSLTLLVSIGRVRVVLPGDIGGGVERSLEADVQSADPGLTVLKVAHHGSAASSVASFLAAARPRLAVVSAGRHNRFGHPAPAVIDRLSAIGSTVLRTDRSGALALVTDGVVAEVFAWDGDRWVRAWRAVA